MGVLEQGRDRRGKKNKGHRQKRDETVNEIPRSGEVGEWIGEKGSRAWGRGRGYE